MLTTTTVGDRHASTAVDTAVHIRLSTTRMSTCGRSAASAHTRPAPLTLSTRTSSVDTSPAETSGSNFLSRVVVE